MDTIDIIMFGALCFVIGMVVGAHWIFASWLKQKPAQPTVIKASLVITPETLRQVNASITLAWLDAQGLTWTAKGAVFNHDKVKK